MPSYKYKAINNAGKYLKGSIIAENPNHLASILRNQKMELISFGIEAKKRIGGINQKTLIALFLHLEELEKAGIPILESVNDLRETGDSAPIRNLMSDISESIKNGSLFSEAMAKHPKIFNSIYIGLVSNGEKTGSLATSFLNIVDDIKWNMEMKRKVRKATIGPIFGIIMMFVVIGVMTTVVVPKVTDFLRSQQINLPLATRALIAFSDFVKSYWYLIVLSPIVTYIINKIMRYWYKFEVYLDSIMLKLPIIGQIIIKIDSARFCQFFGISFKSGLGILECFDAASAVMKNKAIKRNIAIAKQQISDGKSLAEAIKNVGHFPNLVNRMFKIGEESGNMEDALNNIKFFYEREVNDSIERIISLMQPTLTFVMGGMILWIAIAVFGPIYGSFSTMGGR